METSQDTTITVVDINPEASEVVVLRSDRVDLVKVWASGGHLEEKYHDHRQSRQTGFAPAGLEV